MLKKNVLFEKVKNYFNLSVHIRLIDIWPYLAIFLFVISYYYFFAGKAPWLWYDDIYWLELAEKTAPLALLKAVFNFAPKDYKYSRPIIIIFMKFCRLLFFNEDPHYYRIVKAVIFSLTLCLMFYLIVNKGGNKNKYIAILGLFVFATFPPIMIVNTWVNESAAFELFFKISSFIVFFKLISESEKKISFKFVMLSLLLILLIIFADKAKLTAKIIPFLFLAYLLFSKNKSPLLYIVMLISTLTIFPYSSLNSAGSLTYSRIYYIQLFKTFLIQTWPLIIFIAIISIFAKKKYFIRNKYSLFFIIWLSCEILLYMVYPSDEMRYLFASLAAFIILVSFLTSIILKKMKKDNFKKITKFVFIIVTLSMLSINIYWSYNFRGSFISHFILVDKKMKFINQNFKKALCLYSDFTLLYYSRNSSNQYINIHPRYSPEKKHSEIILKDSGRIRIRDTQKYEHVFALDKSLYSNLRPAMVFDSVIQGSLWDSFQRAVNLKMYNANLYNVFLKGPSIYPQYSAIYKLP